MDFAMVPVKLYVACVLMNMCGLFMLKHEFAGEEEDGSFFPFRACGLVMLPPFRRAGNR